MTKRSVSLRDCWNHQWANHDNETSKLAAANGMTDQEYLRLNAQQQQQSEHQKKIAEENEYVRGVVRGEGVMDGFAHTMSKFASANGGNQNSADTLIGIFCPNKQ